jgi:DNA-binding PadR family transcriptional regulator
LTGGRAYQTGKHLEAFILLVIAREPLHGGAVLGQLRTLLPTAWTIDDGHVYRLLRSLEADGALISSWITEGSGPPLRQYRLTDDGWSRLKEWKDDITLRVHSLQTFLDLWASTAPWLHET